MRGRIHTKTSSIRPVVPAQYRLVTERQKRTHDDSMYTALASRRAVRIDQHESVISSHLDGRWAVALGPWAPPAERGPSLESIYRVSLTVDLCEGTKIG